MSWPTVLWVPSHRAALTTHSRYSVSILDGFINNAAPAVLTLKQNWKVKIEMR